MSCSLPHNHYCCLLPSTVCLPHLLICTCLISSPIACPPSSVLCWCLLGLFCFFFIFSFVRNGDDYVAIFICVFVHVFFVVLGCSHHAFFLHILSSSMQYCTQQNMSELFEPQDNAIRKQLIPALYRRGKWCRNIYKDQYPTPSPSFQAWSWATAVGLTNPQENTKTDANYSAQITPKLTDKIYK